MILPSSKRLIFCHYKDPYEPISTVECHNRFEHSHKPPKSYHPKIKMLVSLPTSSSPWGPNSQTFRSLLKRPFRYFWPSPQQKKMMTWKSFLAESYILKIVRCTTCVKFFGEFCIAKNLSTAATKDNVTEKWFRVPTRWKTANRCVFEDVFWNINKLWLIGSM